MIKLADDRRAKVCATSEKWMPPSVCNPLLPVGPFQRMLCRNFEADLGNKGGRMAALMNAHVTTVEIVVASKYFGCGLTFLVILVTKTF